MNTIIHKFEMYTKFVLYLVLMSFAIHTHDPWNKVNKTRFMVSTVIMFTSKQPALTGY